MSKKPTEYLTEEQKNARTQEEIMGRINADIELNSTLKTIADDDKWRSLNPKGTSGIKPSK